MALHSRKSFASIDRYRRARPDAPMVVVLPGTDLYNDLHTSPRVLRSMKMATRLVVLHPLAVDALPTRMRRKTRVVIQSAVRPKGRVAPSKRVFEICVIGHLRPVKDPFRAAMAARRLPAESRIRVLHLGAALVPAMRRRARAEERRNPRYRWLGELSRARTMRTLARCRLVVLSSKLEGGANVVSEAIACGTPVLASEIPGSVGLLGRAYRGYFPVGDTAALARLLWRAETDRATYGRLKRAIRRLAPMVRPARERGMLRRLLEEVL